MKKYIIVVLLGLLLTACGGGGSSSSSGGGSSGSVQVFNGTQTVTVSILLGGKVTGTDAFKMEFTSGDILDEVKIIDVDFTDTGVASDNGSFVVVVDSFTISSDGVTCKGTIIYSGTIDGNTVSGTLSGSMTCDGVDAILTGTFTASS